MDYETLKATFKTLALTAEKIKEDAENFCDENIHDIAYVAELVYNMHKQNLSLDQMQEINDITVDLYNKL